jgi:hypothetical protein
MTDQGLKHLAEMMEEAAELLSTVDGLLAWDLVCTAERLRSCTATALVGDRSQLALPGMALMGTDNAPD